MWKETLIGMLAGVFVFLISLGLDPAPFLLLGGVLFVFRFYFQGRGMEKNLETLEYTGEKETVAPVTFADIGGQEVAKRELMEALAFLQDEKKRVI